LHITSARVSHASGQLVVRGTLAPAATGRVFITYRSKVRRRWHAKRVTAALTRGRFSATMTLSRALRAGSAQRATVAYRGSSAIRPASRTVSVG
jgi:hypothetical protein